MNALKQLAWALPTVALAVGAAALVSGFSGASTASDLPAPVEGLPAVEQADAATAVDGETWDAMKKRKRGSKRGDTVPPV